MIQNHLKADYVQPKTPLFTSDSQHPPRFRHAVYLGDDTVCKVVKERSRSRARPSSLVQTIFGQKRFLFDQICFLVGSVSSSLFIP